MSKSKTVVAELIEGGIPIGIGIEPKKSNYVVPCHDPKGLTTTTWTMFAHGRVPESWLTA